MKFQAIVVAQVVVQVVVQVDVGVVSVVGVVLWLLNAVNLRDELTRFVLSVGFHSGASFRTRRLLPRRSLMGAMTFRINGQDTTFLP